MLKHHDAALASALERLYLGGAVSVPWDDLYMWFNVERLTKTVHREIQERWEELCTYYGHTHAPELSILQADHAFPYALRIVRKLFKDEKLVPFYSQSQKD
jgi:hypothetical protein